MKPYKPFIYQLFPRLFGNAESVNIFNGTLKENGCGKFNDITDAVLKQIANNGYTHIWYIGVPAHASATDYTAYGIPRPYPEIVKGNAGSPYAIRDYYDVDPDLADHVPHRMREFEQLVARTHRAGLKVLIDHVPNHVARDYRSVNRPQGVKELGAEDNRQVAFLPRNNFYYLPGQSLEIVLPPAKKEDFFYRESPARATGNDCFSPTPGLNDWYETIKLNYGVDYTDGKSTHFSPIPDTWKKMRDILLFWSRKKVDGFRCDMAEMVPLDYWRWVIPQIKATNPEMVFIAEIYNPSRYRDFLADNLFDFLYDKVGLYDVLREVSCGYRPSSDITFALNAVGDIQHKMLNFMENHDEQRLASDYFLGNGEKGKAAMIVTCCHHTNPVMVYAGQEFGERGMDEEGFSGKNGRTSIFDYWSVDTLRRWNNNGKWDGRLLTPQEKALHDFYRHLIRLCNREPALAKGLFYDLMPANYEHPDFDSTKLFAFLRCHRKNLLLVVANFDNREQHCTIHIPAHAFSFFAIEDRGAWRLTPLLHPENEAIIFSKNHTGQLRLDALSGKLYRLSTV